MSTAGGKAAANDATADTANSPDPPSTRRKAEAAVVYYERELDAAHIGVANAEAKVEKFTTLLAEAKAGLKTARAEIATAEKRVGTARGQLAQMGG